MQFTPVLPLKEATTFRKQFCAVGKWTEKKHNATTASGRFFTELMRERAANRLSTTSGQIVKKVYGADKTSVPVEVTTPRFSQTAQDVSLTPNGLQYVASLLADVKNNNEFARYMSSKPDFVSKTTTMVEFAYKIVSNIKTAYDFQLWAASRIIDEARSLIRNELEGKKTEILADNKRQMA